MVCLSSLRFLNTDMSFMFYAALSFNRFLDQWVVSNVIDMNGMFGYAVLFNKPIDKWDVSKVTNMDSMFWEATYFDQNLCSWGTKLAAKTVVHNIFENRHVREKRVGLEHHGYVTICSGQLCDVLLTN